MTKEFKVKKFKDATVYTLESATGGATSSGNGASVSSPVGGIRKRGDNLIAQEEKKEAPKPRNFVAKNAKMGGAGQHKDKKKAQKQGNEKHRKPYMEELKDRINILKEKLAENSDLAQQMMATARSLGMNPRIHGTPDQERERTQQMLAQRAKDREEKDRQSASDDAAKLPELKAEYASMKKEYEALGGSNWQYADREQNLSDAERKARSMEPALRTLATRIHRAEQGDAYMEQLASKVAEKLNPNAPTDVWVKDFQKANPNKYHQFKNKTPAKKAQMAVAAHYAANEPNKKK